MRAFACPPPLRGAEPEASIRLLRSTASFSGLNDQELRPRKARSTMAVAKSHSSRYARDLRSTCRAFSSWLLGTFKTPRPPPPTLNSERSSIFTFELAENWKRQCAQRGWSSVTQAGLGGICLPFVVVVGPIDPRTITHRTLPLGTTSS